MSGPSRFRRKKRSDDGQRPASQVLPLARLEAYLAGHRPAIVISIVALSVALRIGCFLDLNRGPCIWQHRWDQSDMNYYDSWARQIAGGDWLCRQVKPPLHHWHRRMAQEYYQRHGEELRAIEAASAGGQEPDPAEILWDRWVGGRRYYQDPLYPYSIALTYRFLPDVRWVFAWQMAVGVLSNLLIYVLARRSFGDLAGAVAALMACLYSPFLQNELVLLRETLIIFASLGTVWLTDLAARRSRFAWWLLAGFAAGLSVLLKAHFALFVLGMMVLLAVQYRRDHKAMMRSAAAVAAGVVLALVPLVARNIAVGAAALSTSSGGPVTFAIHNAYEPQARCEDWRVSAASQIMEQTGGRGSTVLPVLKTHPDATSYLELLWNKFSATWHWFELSDNANFYYYRLHSRILRFIPITFFALGPLGIVGLVLAIGRLVQTRYLYLQVLTNMAVLVLFTPLGRFRLPMAAVLVPFAALTVVRIAQLVTSRRVGLAVAVLAGLGLVWLWTARPLPPASVLVRPADYMVAYMVYYNPMAKQAVDSGQWQRAADIVADSLRYEPELVRRMGPSWPAATAQEADLASCYASVRAYYAMILQKTGRDDLAASERQRAAQLQAAIQWMLKTETPRQGQESTPKE